jgi:SAM-dependent methyltransferase
VIALRTLDNVSDVSVIRAAAQRVYRRLPAPPSTNYYLRHLDLDPYDLIPAGGRVLDLGAGTLRGQYAFARGSTAERTFRMIAIDLTPARGVDVCGDAHALPVATASVDGLVCVSVLEYVRSPEQVVSECYRVLKPGGVVYFSAPFVFPHHPPPEDRFRFSMSGMRTLAHRFQELRVGFNRGPASAFCHVFVHFLAVALSFGSRGAYAVLLDAGKWAFFWIKYLDRWIGRYDTAAVLHGSAFFLGRKPLAEEDA